MFGLSTSFPTEGAPKRNVLFRSGLEMNLEHLATLESKGTNKDHWSGIRRTQKPSASGSHWPKMGRFECLKE